MKTIHAIRNAKTKAFVFSFFSLFFFHLLFVVSFEESVSGGRISCRVLIFMCVPVKRVSGECMCVGKRKLHCKSCWCFEEKKKREAVFSLRIFWYTVCDKQSLFNFVDKNKEKLVPPRNPLKQTTSDLTSILLTP